LLTTQYFNKALSEEEDAKLLVQVHAPQTSPFSVFSGADVSKLVLPLLMSFGKSG